MRWNRTRDGSQGIIILPGEVISARMYVERGTENRSCSKWRELICRQSLQVDCVGTWNLEVVKAAHAHCRQPETAALHTASEGSHVPRVAGNEKQAAIVMYM